MTSRSIERALAGHMPASHVLRSCHARLTVKRLPLVGSWSRTAGRVSGQFLKPWQVDIVGPVDPSVPQLLGLHPTSATPASYCTWLDADFAGEFL